MSAAVHVVPDPRTVPVLSADEAVAVARELAVDFADDVGRA